MTISSNADVRSRPQTAGAPGPVPAWQRRRPARPRASVRLAAALAGVVAIVFYLYIALRRLDYPYALEPLEGNSLIEVHRILSGQPLYPAPSAGYVPDGYTPLYFYVSAAVASVLGGSYLPLRLVSLVSSLVAFGMLARLVQRETSSAAAGVAAAGVFAATYFFTGQWFDIGRVDSLFVALSLAGLYAVRHMRGARGAVAAGVLLAAAALTKQTALAEGAAVLAAVMTGPRRRLAGIAALSWAVAFGAAVLALREFGGGWFDFYVFELLDKQALTDNNFSWFWTATLTALGLAALAALLGALTSERRVPLELLAGCAAMFVEGYVALVHSGGALNDVMPSFAAVALLAGLALGSRVRWVTIASGLLVLAQIVFLLVTWHPSQAIPTAADRAVGEKLAAGMRALGGDVVVPQQPSLSMQDGMATTAHPGAVYDVLRAKGDNAAQQSFRSSAFDAVADRKYRAVISDSPGQPLFDPSNLAKYYQECVQRGPVGPDTLLVPVPESAPLPAVVWIPRGSGTCQSVISVLNGAAR